jgi:C-terminal processing protease CtpA/Prc
VSTKRAYFPDGSQFEGVGIEPNVEIAPSAADLRAGRDPVLKRRSARGGSGTRLKKAGFDPLRWGERPVDSTRIFG